MSDEEREEVDDIRANIEDAISAVESSEEPTEAAAEPAEVEPVSEAAPAEDVDTTEVETPEVPETPEEPEPEEFARAPQSWSAKVREHWKNLPPDVRDFVHRREREFATTIQNTTEDTKYGQAMQEILRPFESVMAMESATPFQAVKSLAQTAATLRMGTPSQKADTIKALINAYDVDINMLDQALVGEPTLSPEQKAFQSMIDQRLGPVEQMMQELRQNRQQMQATVDARYDQEIDQFEADSANEFYQDVRGDMADLIEVAHRRGYDMPLKEAYDRAISLRPDLQEIVSARKNEQILAKKRAAASTLQPTQPVGNGEAPPDTLRGAIEAAFDSNP